ncbi:MAG: hypothetical protein LAP85_14015 [Acidobacteriia bacterium]|nr:hypothetical protein [Terriglobia bacterium]
MITDPVPRSSKRRVEYESSDAMIALAVPGDGRFHALALEVEATLASGSTRPVRAACTALLSEAARFYGVAQPDVRVLAARPLRVYETGATELFGDYDPRTALIRVWMRTAVQRRVTSFGTFLSTLCHEFCHHLDMLRFGFTGTPHTRGFYQRAAVLYHHCRGTPLRPLIWRRILRGRWQIDWARMRVPRGSGVADSLP